MQREKDQRWPVKSEFTRKPKEQVTHNHQLQWVLGWATLVPLNHHPIKMADCTVARHLDQEWGFPSPLVFKPGRITLIRCAPTTWSILRDSFLLPQTSFPTLPLVDGPIELLSFCTCIVPLLTVPATEVLAEAIVTSAALSSASVYSNLE